MIGHLLRWSAYYLLYKAIIETGLVKPYSIFLRNLKRSDDELRSHAADLQTRNDELDAYAHTVAHDLKNPLTIITAAADVVNTVRNLTPAEIQEYLQQIKDTALEMSSIIDDLLLLAEVRSVDVPLGPVDMQDIVRTVQKRLDFLLKKYRARLVLPAAWPGAIGYAPWIQEVWANYISNALKYGGPSPKIELGASLAAGGMVRFWAQDHGPGVPADSASLFIPFSQLRSRRRDGHGLGLSIVLHIVQKLGGEVGVENVQGKGALFYFMLPSSQTPRGITEGALPPATTT
jgi:two-component system sensor histidine kinase/response regulator